MADDVSRQGPEDEVRIDPHSQADVSYWADKLNLSEDRLRSLIEQVGPRLQDIELIIGKYTPTSNPR